MKKVLIVVVVLLLLGAGGYYLYMQKLSPKSSSTPSQSGGIFGSIKDALSKQLSLQCTFTTDDGVATTAFLKAGAVRVDSNGKTADQMGSFIMRDKKIYFWQSNSKQGTMMDIAAVSVTPGSTGVAPTNAAQKESDNVMTTLEKFKDKCKAAVVSDSLFTPPTDVKFTNISEMMKAVPTGSPNGMNQQDVQKLMQQYQQPSTGY